eukprot:jgi/Bigna1/133016/aug1.19_g7724
MGLRIQDSPARAFRKKRISEYIARHGDKDDDFETNITRGARIKLRKQRVKNLRLILENKADTLSPESREKLKSWLESSSEMPRISLGANKMRMIPGSNKKENPSMDGRCLFKYSLFASFKPLFMKSKYNLDYLLGSKRYYKRRGGRRRRPQTFGNLMMVASSEKRTNKPSRLSDIAESKLSPSKAGQMGATRIEEAVDLKHVKQQQQQQYEKMIGTQYQETKSTTDLTVPSTFKFLSEILITLGVLMICYAIVGTRLFYGLYDEKWRDDARFDSFGLSLISLFILLTTENYPLS